MIIPASNSLALLTVAIGLVTSPAITRWIDAATLESDHEEPDLSSKPLAMAPAQIVYSGTAIAQNDAEYDAHIVANLGDEEDTDDGDLIAVEWIPGVGLVDRS
jgi:hypothetical protein